jgi:hypothetical protein
MPALDLGEVMILAELMRDPVLFPLLLLPLLL